MQGGGWKITMIIMSFSRCADANFVRIYAHAQKNNFKSITGTIVSIFGFWAEEIRRKYLLKKT